MMEGGSNAILRPNNTTAGLAHAAFGFRDAAETPCTMPCLQPLSHLSNRDAFAGQVAAMLGLSVIIFSMF